MIEQIQKQMNEQRDAILEWTNKQRKKLTLPIYSSFDIRDNGVKAAIVDSNLFPAGFNNLTADAQKMASTQLKEYLATHYKNAQDVLIIPEAHTRNLFYLSNLNAIQTIFEKAGMNVTLGSIREDIDDTLKVEDSNGKKLVLEKMVPKDDCLSTSSFHKGLIVLNNDFSQRHPPLLDKVCSPITPPLALGWAHRKKSNHFDHLCSLIGDFSKEFGFDDWLFCPRTQAVNNVDFSDEESLAKIAGIVDETIERMKGKFQKYGIMDKPNVFIKDNSGTYGMGVITVNQGSDVLSLNAKQRGKMKKGKESSKITSVVVQEGIATKHTVDGKAAEPVIYTVGGKVVGGFMRIHESKDNKSSLNAPGSKFDVLLEDNITGPLLDQCDKENLSLYTVLANLGNIAIGNEMADAK